MYTITLSTEILGMTNSVISIPVLPAINTRYSVISVGSIQEIQPVIVVSKSKAKFSNPIDQMAWESYKKIEPRYSEANRRLAE